MNLFFIGKSCKEPIRKNWKGLLVHKLFGKAFMTEGIHFCSVIVYDCDNALDFEDSTRHLLCLENILAWVHSYPPSRTFLIDVHFPPILEPAPGLFPKFPFI